MRWTQLLPEWARRVAEAEIDVQSVVAIVAAELL
jgi:hypothetical protein